VLISANPVCQAAAPILLWIAAAALPVKAQTPIVSTGDVTRLITYSATVNNPVLRLNLEIHTFGPATLVGGSVTTIYNLLYHVDPAIVALIGTGPVYHPPSPFRLGHPTSPLFRVATQYPPL
jgi:hypothetical protein